MAYCTIIPRIKLGNPQIGLISELRFVWSNTSSLAAINPPKNELFQEPEARFILWAKQFLGPLQLQRKILVQLLKSRISEIFWVSSITWRGSLHSWAVIFLGSAVGASRLMHVSTTNIEKLSSMKVPSLKVATLIIFHLYSNYLECISASTPAVLLLKKLLNPQGLKPVDIYWCF